MKAIQLTGGLYLLEQPLGAAVPPAPVRQATHHKWIGDCSYSMYDVMSQLRQHLKEQVDFIPEGDRLSLGWFSSEGGQHEWVTKALQINTKADREAVKKLIDKKFHCRGTTCFSGILAEVPQLIDDMSVFDMPVSFVFLTDGKPVVSWGSKEEMRRSTAALSKIEKLVVAGLFVGYGPFYDRQNLMDMTKAVGGNFLHADSMKAFNMALQTLIETGKALEAKAEVTLEGSPFLGMAFTVAGGQVGFYRVEGGKVNLATGKAAADRVFYVSDKLPKGAEIVALERALEGDGEAAAVYASQALAVRTGRQDLAIDIASTVGDVAVVEALDGALNNRELGEAEKFIFDAAFFPARRFSKGRRPGQVPPADKFSIVDLYTLLMKDDDARLHVKKLPYKRIGPPQVIDDTYPRFVDDTDAATPMNRLGWNKELLNLSVLCDIPGTVELRDQTLADGRRVTPEQLGLTREFKSRRYANRTVVKDGSPWMLELPVSLSLESFRRLKSEGLIPPDATWAAEKFFRLDLSGLKVVNRAMVEGATSAETLCQLYLKDRRYYGQLKALNSILLELDPEKKVGVKTQYSADQVEFLKLNGIDHTGRYSPPKKEGVVTDYYMAHVFKISAKGLSDGAFKNVEEVRGKLAGGKKLTPAEEMVHSGIIQYESAARGIEKAAGKADTLGMRVDWLRQNIAGIKAEQLAVRGEMAKLKIAVALNHRWFDEASGRDQTDFEFGGQQFTIVLDERKEKF